MHLRLLYAFILLFSFLPSGAVKASNAYIWVVSPQGPITSIQQALNLAADGDTILVEHGIYPGPLVVAKSIALVGRDFPIIDGGGVGMVVSLEAPGIQMRGFKVRGSGSEPDRDHSGIAVKAADILVENNRLTDVLFGVFVAQADRAIIRNNEISSKLEYDIARRGDGIRVWYSQDVTIEHNLVQDVRDLVAWYSSNLVFRKNQILNGRYGVHLMYSDNAIISENSLLDNSVGIYIMYSHQVALFENDIRRQRGPSGYALGFKDTDNVLVQNNLLVDNRAGIFMDGTPFRPDSFARFEGNLIAFNDIGVLLFSFVNRAEFRGNTLWENVQQTALQGSGKAGDNTWIGNYWSDYSGYDANGDGFGELPYRSDRFFEGLMDQEPRLRALLFSPAAQAIEFASLAFPVIKPQPKLEDPRPSVIPKEIPASIRQSNGRNKTLNLMVTGSVLLLAGLGIVMVGLSGERWMKNQQNQNPDSQEEKQASQDTKNASQALIQVNNLSKRYGKTPVLRDLNLKVYPGEALALWGENGAGKTTLLKSILGLVKIQGQILVAGEDISQRGKQARKLIGYVPQETVFYDISVSETLGFYARIKKVNPQRIPELVERLGLRPHQHKPVTALSGGLKQRLALAVALLSDPPLLLLDEPTANLDARARKEYLDLLRKLRREGKTILFASHRLDEVETLADRVVILEAGQQVDELQPSELRARLAPDVLLTVWVPERQHQAVIALFAAEGWEAHVNGRGTVVVFLSSKEKVLALQRLAESGIQVHDFELEGVNASWN